MLRVNYGNTYDFLRSYLIASEIHFITSYCRCCHGIYWFRVLTNSTCIHYQLSLTTGYYLIACVPMTGFFGVIFLVLLPCIIKKFPLICILNSYQSFLWCWTIKSLWFSSCYSKQELWCYYEFNLGTNNRWFRSSWLYSSSYLLLFLLWVYSSCRYLIFTSHSYCDLLLMLFN